MIRKLIQQVIGRYFLHIEINTINLPYWRLPRPYRTNLLSGFMRRFFEKRWIWRVIGVNFTTALLAIPAVGYIDSFNQPEQNFNFQVPHESGINQPVRVTTESRKFVEPVTDIRYISQKFALGHAGYDLASYVGSSVVAFSSGQVYQTESLNWGLGRYVIVDHGHGLFSVYAHLQSFSVSPGMWVEAGEKIGEVGMTGYTTGPHLHFEVHDNGIAVNPGIYLDI